jgi:hypothetical protein
MNRLSEDTLRELGVTPRMSIAGHLEDARRTELMAAMRLADSSEDRDLHVRLGRFVNDLDDFRAVLAESSTR